MRTVRRASHAAVLAVLTLALALTARSWAQPTPPSTAPPSTPTAQPAPGTTPVGGDTPADTVNPEKAIEPGSRKTNVKPGSIDDVSAVGHRRIGGPGLGNWYSAGTESRMGKLYALEIEKSVPLISDPLVTGYMNRIGQKIVMNSDCQQPFTIKVIDSEQINAFALPGGFLFVSSGLILKAGNEAELAGVMAHEIAHVCAHHAAREMTRLGYTQLGAIPLIMVGGWAGCGLSAASGIVVPAAFMQFSREFEEQADYLGVQYIYRAGYDPRAYISFFERVQALEKRNPGAVAKLFAGHPQTPSRILRTQQEIARILPPQAEYTTATLEFTAIKARLEGLENQRLPAGSTSGSTGSENGQQPPLPRPDGQK
jgi:predicted Zn-dependent protease